MCYSAILAVMNVEVLLDWAPSYIVQFKSLHCHGPGSFKLPDTLLPCVEKRTKETKKSVKLRRFLALLCVTVVQLTSLCLSPLSIVVVRWCLFESYGLALIQTSVVKNEWFRNMLKRWHVWNIFPLKDKAGKILDVFVNNYYQVRPKSTMC